MKDESNILDTVAAYYSEKLATHGETPRGVDWNSPESQVLRFEQLLRIIEGEEPFSLTDLGCGYGALLEHLRKKGAPATYLGYDVSASMIKAAQARFKGDPGARFFASGEPRESTDYAVASGIFNVRLHHNVDEWWNYLTATLDRLNRAADKGFAFNCLTSYSDAHRMRDDLYYADPGVLFDFCKKKYSRQVALLHDYDLYEFTILVRKRP